MFATKLRISQKMDKVLGRTNSGPPACKPSALTTPPRYLLKPFQTYKVAQARRKKTEVKDLIQDNYTRYLTRAIISFICN